MLRIAVARLHDAPSAGDDAAPAWMGESERRRWADLAPGARRAFAASRALLRELLRAATGVPDDGWDVSALPGTAPVARSLRGDIAVHVSLSHRLGWVAAAVADVPVGVDVECERPARSNPAERAQLMLSPAELAAWRAWPPDDLEAALLARWTAKEAWFKASPPESAPWDFRRVAARACAPADAGANVRTWAAPPLHVAVCCPDPLALAVVDCDGPLPTVARTSFWHVHAH
jgi:4'-phosphopantetheinyl transferase